MDNKEKFIYTARKYINRNGIEELLKALEATDFYTAPASTKFHDSVEGGLCYHSLKVFDHMEEKNESTAICALFHDLCKIGYYIPTWKNVKTYSVDGDKRDEGGRFKWVAEKGYTVDDKFPLGHGEKSLYMVRDFMTLGVDEALAIRWHMGGYEPKENYTYLSTAFTQCPLAVKLHIADLSATYFQ